MIPRYSRPELAAIWEDKQRFELWLEIELAVCEAMEAAGTVPAGTAQQVRAAAAGKLDPKKILEIEQTTRHDVIAFLTHVEELAGEPARWLHLGMTSSDVLDSCLAIQTGRALERVIAGVMTAGIIIGGPYALVVGTVLGAIAGRLDRHRELVLVALALMATLALDALPWPLVMSDAWWRDPMIPTFLVLSLVPPVGAALWLERWTRPTPAVAPAIARQTR